jgi:hypothetical protein
MNQDPPPTGSSNTGAAPPTDARASESTPARSSKTAGGGQGRGFAGMDPMKQRAIASEGGKAAHASGHAHEFSSEEARRAGSLSHGGRGRDAVAKRSDGGHRGDGSGSR